MECFTHSGVSAVGVCMGCGKAICRSCIVPTELSLACSETCAREVTALHELNKRKLEDQTKPAKKTSALFLPASMYFVLGTVATGVGIINTVQAHRTDYSSLGFGVVFLLFAIVAYRMGRHSSDDS